MSRTYNITLKFSTTGLDASINRVRSFGNLINFLNRSLFSLKGLIAGFLAAATVKRVLEYGDSWVLANNRLRAFVRTTGEANLLQIKLYESAQRVRIGFESTIATFQRFLNIKDALRKTTSELVSFTETLNKAIALSGATELEAEAGLQQLAQGMSRRLGGDELRAVTEQLPFVASIIAQELSKIEKRQIPIGMLQYLGAQGKITAKVILDAFENASKDINERFGRMTPTIGQAFVVLDNSIRRVTATLLKSSGIYDGLSNTLITMAKALDAISTLAPRAANELASYGLVAGRIGMEITDIGVGDTRGQSLKDWFESQPTAAERQFPAQRQFAYPDRIDLIDKATAGENFKAEESIRTIGDYLRLRLSEAIKKLKPAVIELITGSLTFLGLKLVEVLLNALRYGLPAILEILWELAKSFAKVLVNAVVDAAGPIMQAFKINYKPDPNNASPTTSGVLANLQGIFDGTIDGLRNAQAGAAGGVGNAWSDAKSTVLELIKELRSVADSVSKLDDLFENKIDMQGILDMDKAISFEQRMQEMRRELRFANDLSGSPERNKQVFETSELVGTRYGVPGAFEIDLAKQKFQEFLDLLDKIEWAEKMRRLAEGIGESFGSAFENIIFGVESVSEAIENLVKDVAKQVFNTLVTQQISGFFAGLAGGALGTTGTPFKLFARGGIVDQPTFVGLADGFPAIAGEGRTAEAVIPLPDGRSVPVQMMGYHGNDSNGANNVRVYMTVNTPDASSFRRSDRQITERLTRSMRRAG